MLVKKLEELGIGRPSTYATIINTVQARGYAEKGESEGMPRDLTYSSLSTIRFIAKSSKKKPVPTEVN